MIHHCGTLRDHWYVAAMSRQVTARRPWSATIMDVPLVLFRDGAGRARALLDRCLHRNAPLSRGALFDGCIGCPYHGWTYDGDGRLVVVPSEVEAPSERTGLALRAFPVIEQDGLVWVYMGDPGRAGVVTRQALRRRAERRPRPRRTRPDRASAPLTPP